MPKIKKEPPSWATLLGSREFKFNAARLFDDSELETAVIVANVKPVFHPRHHEVAYRLEPGLWVIAPVNMRIREQHIWRESRYLWPNTVATWASVRSSAENAQIRRAGIDRFKNQHGQLTRPSERDPNKPVLDENEIAYMLKAGMSSRDISLQLRIDMSTIQKMRRQLRRAGVLADEA
jgi:DNA-binding CsgD family transcriptional regulator